MPRAKKVETENVASEATTEKVIEKPTKEDLRQAMIDLGLDMCKDYKEGRVRPEATLVNALTELFKAVNYKE
jgi:hypothetical protein